MVATCIASALATFVMGLAANYPIALAPGMGHNFFFSYVVVLTLGYSWQEALGAVFISGVLFILLSFIGRGSVNKCVNRHQAAFSWVTGLTGTPLTYWAPW